MPFTRAIVRPLAATFACGITSSVSRPGEQEQASPDN